MSNITQEIGDKILQEDSGLIRMEGVYPTETVSLVEQVAKRIESHIADSLSLNGTISKIAVMFELTDSQTFAEEMTTSIGLGRTDVMGIAEVVIKSIQASIIDNIELSDVDIEIVKTSEGEADYKRNEVDILNIIDEQISKYVANKTDSQTITDGYGLNVGAPKSDDITFSEGHKINVNGAYSDSVNFTESEKMRLRKIVGDNLLMADGTQEYDVTIEVWWGMIKCGSAAHGGL